MNKMLWVWREVVATDQPADYDLSAKKLKATGRAFVMRSPDTLEGTTEVLGVFDSFEAAMKMVNIGNER